MLYFKRFKFILIYFCGLVVCFFKKKKLWRHEGGNASAWRGGESFMIIKTGYAEHYNSA